MKIFLRFFGITIFSLISIYNPAFAQEKVMKLPAPNLSSGKLLMQSLQDRKSTRAFSNKEIPIETLSNLLWAANGINRPDKEMRTAPSAMNLQEIEIYVAMKTGLYLYNHKNHSLELTLGQDIRRSAGIQDFLKDAPITLIYVVNLGKLTFKPEENILYYGTDIGFISQNVYLFCASENLATVILGWIDKPTLEKIMTLDEKRKVVFTQPVGYPAE